MRAFWNKSSISGATRDGTLAPILANAYRLLEKTVAASPANDIERDITRLFRSNAERWMNFNKS